MEVYESCNTENKSEQMDDILDFLNGLIEKHEIKDQIHANPNNIFFVHYYPMTSP